MIDEPYVSTVDRIPPANLEAEMAVIGGLMVEPEMIDVVASIVTPGDFHATLHETVYVALQSLHAAGKPLDKIAVAEELRSRGMLERIGGLAYLATLMDTVPSHASMDYYARIIREKAALRGLIHAGARITQLGYEGEDDATGALTEAEMVLSRVSLASVQVKSIEPSAAALDRILADMRSGKREEVVYTPWASINRMTGGFRGGELIAVPAAPSVGKTGFVLCIAEYAAARREKGAVLFASLEMGADAMHRRRIAQRSNVSARAQRLGRLESMDRQQIQLAVNELRERQFFIVGDECNTIASLWRAARDVVRQAGKLQVLIIDQMGWIDDINREVRGTTRHDRKSAAFLSLIKLGREFDCPVIAVDHLNRSGNEGRPTFATLSKIRDGGNIEGHAHHVIFPYRADPIERPEVGEAIVAKTRDGQPGPIPMHYDGARALWCEARDDGSAVRPWFEMARRNEPVPDELALMAEAAASPDYSDFDGPSPFDISA
jgi:replicative DNA helicase